MHKLGLTLPPATRPKTGSWPGVLFVLSVAASIAALLLWVSFELRDTADSGEYQVVYADIASER